MRTFAQAARLYPGMPDTTSQAQYRLAFAIATMLRHGRIGPEHVSGAGLSDPGVAAILPRIRIIEDQRHSSRFPLGRWSDVTVHLTDGRKFHSGDVHARGGPEAPMDAAEIRAKFFAMAETALGQERASAIWAMRDRLVEPDARFAELAALVAAPPR